MTNERLEAINKRNAEIDEMLEVVKMEQELDLMDFEIEMKNK